MEEECGTGEELRRPGQTNSACRMTPNRRERELAGRSQMTVNESKHPEAKALRWLDFGGMSEV